MGDAMIEACEFFGRLDLLDRDDEAAMDEAQSLVYALAELGLGSWQ